MNGVIAADTQRLTQAISAVRKFSRELADVETRQRLIPIERNLVWALMMAEAGRNLPTIMKSIDAVAAVLGS
ncbi:hypothetical protein [Azospirillum rugosum]|uniref:Uncharacterized protein n=1 Tax=Azospirillum rugosum TaxID=416170 RepID=A0ABS4SW79_9PROT|nr:hypothetical protein [Azospirillum rugosum]MBP2296318.1 hypothetical protein [Azospirillum rugosum]MDQ0529839.1 hypothetical protein [Azospirillum rugosum]